MSHIKFLVPPGRRIVMLLLTYIVGFIVTGVISAMLLRMGGAERHVAMMRIATVVQDIFLFIVPALLTAVIVTRQPVRLLAIASMPRLSTSLVAIAVMLVSSPLMTWIIELNDSITLPGSMAALERSLRAMEDAAAGSVELMLGPSTLPNLIVNILIIGIMAGFSEELFFRGALQRLLSTTRLGKYSAVWIAAIIFSALHMQFFGFVPRMLLGVFFGLMLIWSGSLWLPILLHALNNSMYVVLKYATGSGDPSFDMMPRPATIALSALLTAYGLWWLWRNRVGQPSNSPINTTPTLQQ